MHRRSLSVIITTALWLTLGALASDAVAQTPPVVINDGDFADLDWQVDATSNTGATQSVQQELTGGNPDAFRHMFHTLPPPSSVSVYHLRLGQTYDPSTQGAIAGIGYREDRIEFNPPFSGAAVGAGLMLVQGGTRYFYVGADLNPFTNLGWQRFEATCLQANQFTSGGPDFSSSGGPIQFGFLRSNTNNSTTQQTVVEHGIDNWRVIVYPAPNPTCTGLPECAGAVDCDDFDSCTTDTCTNATCASAPIDCDDDLACTTDTCAAGACEHSPFGDFDLVESKINELITILKGTSCGTDPLSKPLARKLKKKLAKARGKIGHADAATKAALITKLLGKADALLAAANTFIANALARDLISDGCAGALQGFLGEIQMCVDALTQT